MSLKVFEFGDLEDRQNQTYLNITKELVMTVKGMLNRLKPKRQ